jgi:hypothetical protein
MHYKLRKNIRFKRKNLNLSNYLFKRIKKRKNNKKLYKLMI